MMLISFSIQIFAQMRDYTAMVVDAENGKTLPYANIRSSANVMTMSNSEGCFCIRANPNDTLSISHIGYRTITGIANQPFDRIENGTSVRNNEGNYGISIDGQNIGCNYQTSENGQEQRKEQKTTILLPHNRTMEGAQHHV